MFRPKDAGPEVPGTQIPKGRAKGGGPKDVVLAREAIAKFVDKNAGRLERWLVAIEQEHGPKAAFECMTTLIEYRVPKLSRVEHRGDGDGPVEMVIKWSEE